MEDLLPSLGGAATPGGSSFSISIEGGGGGEAAAAQDAFDAFIEGGGAAAADAPAAAESEAALTKSLKKKKKKKKKKKEIASFEDEFGPDPEINRFMQMDGGDVEMQSVDKVYGQRWWILFFHSLLVFCASVVCYSYTAIMEETAKCFGIGEGWIALFPSAFFLTAVPMALAAGFTLQRRDLRFTVLLGAWLVAGGAVFRMLNHWHWTMALAGQAVSGSGAPLLLLSAEVMGALWFPADERDLAVSIIQACAWLGAAFAFLAGPFLLRNRDEAMLFSVVVVDTAVSFLAVAAAVGATLVFRSTPPSPPTVAAPTLAHDQVPFGHSWMDMLVPLVQDARFAMSAGGVAVCGLIAHSVLVLLDVFLWNSKFSTATKGYLGALFVLAYLLGRVVATVALSFTQQYRWLMMLSLFGASGSMFFFTSSIPLDSLPTMVLALLAIGFCVGGLDPVAMLFGVQVAFPLSRGKVGQIYYVASSAASGIAIPIIAGIDGADKRAPRMVLLGLCAAAAVFFFINIVQIATGREFIAIPKITGNFTRGPSAPTPPSVAVGRGRSGGGYGGGGGGGEVAL
jgi:MFS family permease